MAVSSFSMVLRLSVAAGANWPLAADSIESKEAGFMVLGPGDIPAIGGVAPVFLAGGVVTPAQYNIAISITAAAIVM
jgi:hypothetical protein